MILKRNFTPYSGLKNPSFSHQLYHAASTYLGLYESGIGHAISFFSPGLVSCSYNATPFSFLIGSFFSFF